MNKETQPYLEVRPTLIDKLQKSGLGTILINPTEPDIGQEENLELLGNIAMALRLAWSDRQEYKDETFAEQLAAMCSEDARGERIGLMIAGQLACTTAAIERIWAQDGFKIDEGTVAREKAGEFISKTMLKTLRSSDDPEELKIVVSILERLDYGDDCYLSPEQSDELRKAREERQAQRGDNATNKVRIVEDAVEEMRKSGLN